MKYYIRLGLVLLVITSVASGILAYINSITLPLIQENERRVKAEARQEVHPEAARFDSLTIINGETVFTALDEEDQVIGYTLVAMKYGYSSEVKTMVGLNPDLSINRIKIISQSETPGLGANCLKTEFQDAFRGLIPAQLQVDKDGGEIVSITGATITTRTVANSIRDAIANLRQHLDIDTASTLQEVKE